MNEEYEKWGVAAGLSLPYSEIEKWLVSAVDVYVHAVNNDTYDGLYAYFADNVVERIVALDSLKMFDSEWVSLGDGSGNENMVAVSFRRFIPLGVVASGFSRMVPFKVEVYAEPRTAEHPLGFLWVRERWEVRLPDRVGVVGESSCEVCGAPKNYFQPYCTYCKTYFPVAEGTGLLVVSKQSI